MSESPAALFPKKSPSSRLLPNLPPDRKFRGTDSIAGEIAFMQACELGFGKLDKTPAVFRVNLFLRPSGYSRDGVLSSDPGPDEIGDQLAELFTVVKPEGVWFAENLPNRGVAGG
jgi:hypothetical protein